MIRNRVPAVTLVLYAVLASGQALAQVEQRGSTSARQRNAEVRVTNAEGASYTARFDDDLLTSLVSGGDIPKIEVRGTTAYGYLIRPRTQFVRELLKSVELL